MNGGVEHAAEVGAIDRTAVHADADEATRALVHDHEHPVAPEHDGLASKEVHTPQAVCRVADERQPRGPGAARDGATVCRQHAVHDVLIDVDPKRSRDDARNPWTAEPRIPRLELDDGLDKCLARPLRSGFLRALARREQSAVFATHQRLMKRQERRGAYADGDLSDSSSAEEKCPESEQQPVTRCQAWRSLARTAQDDQLLLEQKILRDHRSHATGATQRRGHDGQVKQGEQEGLHVRDSVGQTSVATQRGLKPGCSERIGNSRRTGDDATTALDLITAVEGPLVRVTADAAYDTVAVYETAGARGATVVIPPARTANVSGHGPRSPARDRTITLVKTLGRRRWKKASGYHRQGRVENAFFRYKSIIGDGLRARSPAGQGSEVVLGCEILNRMTELGRPVSYRLGR